MSRILSCYDPIFKYFCLYRLGYSETREVLFSFGSGNLILNQIKDPIDTLLEFKIPSEFENDLFGRLELMVGLKIIIEIASYLYIATYPWTSSGNRNSRLTDDDIIRSGPIHDTIENFFQLLGTPAIRNLKSTLIPLLQSNNNTNVQYSFPKISILTRNSQSTLVTQPDFASFITTSLIDTNSSDLIILKDYRLLSPESFEKYKLLSSYIQYIIHELISALHYHQNESQYHSHIQEIFSEKLKFALLDQRQLTFHSQQITFPTLQLSRATHRLIAAINSREGILSDLIGAYLMSADLVPVVKQKRNISSLAPDDFLLSFRTKKKARYASLLAISEEISHRKFFPPLSIYLPHSNWNLKEYLPQHKSFDMSTSTTSASRGDSIPEHLGYHPVMYQDRIQANTNTNTSSNLPFEISQLFDSHHHPSATSSASSSSSSSAADHLQSCRVEMISSSNPAAGDENGGYETGDGLGITSGFPSNELQNYFKLLLLKKIKKHEKYQIMKNKFHHSAYAAMGVVMEELATHFMETWRDNIRQKFDDLNENQENLSSQQDPPNSSSSDLSGSNLHSTLPKSSLNLLMSIGGTLPGPLTYSKKLFEIVTRLQLQGSNCSNPQEVLLTIQNRVEWIFGMKLNDQQKRVVSQIIQQERDQQIEKKNELQDILFNQSQEYYSLKRHPRRLNKK